MIESEEKWYARCDIRDCEQTTERTPRMTEEVTAQDIDQPDDLRYDAWMLLANVSEGDWTKQTPEWQEAVVRWRDAWHKTLAPPQPTLRDALVAGTHAHFHDGCECIGVPQTYYDLADALLPVVEAAVSAAADEARADALSVAADFLASKDFAHTVWKRAQKSTTNSSFEQSRRNVIESTLDDAARALRRPKSAPTFGDHVQDGGEWGTIVRCPECGGTGQLHELDVMPTPARPTEGSAP